MIVHDAANAQPAANWAAQEVTAFSSKAVHVAYKSIKLFDDRQHSQAVGSFLPTA